MEERSAQDIQEQLGRLAGAVREEGTGSSSRLDASLRDVFCRPCHADSRNNTQPQCFYPAMGGQSKLDQKERQKQDVYDKVVASDVARQSPPIESGEIKPHELQKMESVSGQHEIQCSQPHDTHKKRPMLNNTPHSSQRKNAAGSSPRMRLMVLVKTVLRCLECDDPDLHLQAKQIVAECTLKNRQGHPDYCPLSDAIIRRLRLAVGEVNWGRAENLMNHYMATRVESDSIIAKRNRAPPKEANV